MFLSILQSLFNRFLKKNLEGRDKANNKVEFLIGIIEEKLPQGSMGWQEVAAIYQFQSQKNVPCDHENIRRQWMQQLMDATSD